MEGFNHYSVMLKETVDGLDIKPDGVYVDCTAGGGGHSLEIVKRLSEKGHLYAIDQDINAIEAARERLADYLDQVTLQSLDYIDFEFDDYVAEINRLKSTNKFFNIGYSNLDPEKLKKVATHTNYFEGLFNLENKINEDNEILKTCKENAIPFYAYQPLRRNRTAKQNYPVLVELSQKYQKTQNQIILNWLLIHKKIGVLVKSSNKEHIAENIGALGFVMEEDDYVVLDKFRNAEFDKLLVSYKTEEGKVRIDQIPNQPIGVL